MLSKYLWVFFISMLPLIELRGAIPVGYSLNLPGWSVLIVSVIGNILPLPFIYIFARRFLLWGQSKPFIHSFCRFCLRKGENAGKKLQEKGGRGLFVALMLFVAIPLPGTGAWTGTLAASILNMDFKSSMIACIFGILIAALIMTLASLGVSGLIAS